MGRSGPCELVRRGLPWANQRLVLSLCDDKHSSSQIIWHQRPQPPNQQLLSALCAETEKSSWHGGEWWGVHCFSAVQNHHVFTQYNNALTITSSPFFPILMPTHVWGCFRGNLTEGYKSLMFQQHVWYWTNFWPGLKVKFRFGIIYNHWPKGRLFPISRYCFVLLCSLNLVFPKRL